MRLIATTEKQNEEYDKKAIADLILNRLDDVWPAFAEKNTNGQRNLNYYMGKQWTDEEIAAHRTQNRKAYVFNETFSKIDHLIGTQTQTRMDAKAIPRERTDDLQVRMLNFIIKWFEQTNNIEFTETDVFTDATIKGAGASVIRWELEDMPNGYPSIESVPIEEMYWDLDAQKVDLSDARWMARVQYLTRREAKEIFPTKKKQIDNMSQSFSVNAGRIRNIMNERREKYLQKGRALTQDDEIVPLVEYCDWDMEPVYVVIDEITGHTEEFDNESDAQNFYDGLIEGYVAANEELLNPNGTGRVLIVETSQKQYKLITLIGDEVLTYDKIHTPFFPWDICFSYFSKGDYWAFADNMISPQDLINRAFSQLDYQLGATVKGAVTVIPTLLRGDFTMEKARNEWSKTSPMIPVLSHEAFHPIPAGRVQAELFEEVNFGIQRMTDYAGGKNALGLQENAAESGRAVIARAEQGGIGKLPLFDKLRLWRQNVTYKAIWYIKNHMPPGQVLRIIGGDEDVTYINIDDGILDSLKEIKLDVVVDEAMKSETMRERNFQQLKELFAQQPYPPEITMPIMLEYSNIPESKKRTLRDQLNFYQKYMQQQQEMQKENKLQGEVEDSLKRQQIKAAMQRGQEAEDKKQELDTKEKGVRASLNKIDEIRLKLKNPELSIEDKNKLYDELNTRSELAQRDLANIPSS